uniref:Uncharacterized protein n=1 Tax=Arundo donax TaxID=35708 RepID=A0A0A9DH13_ARUDO
MQGAPPPTPSPPDADDEKEEEENEKGGLNYGRACCSCYFRWTQGLCY